MTIAIVLKTYCVAYWRVLCLRRRWSASSLQQSLPVTWIDQGIDRKSTRLNSSHTVIYTLSLHDALPISQDVLRGVLARTLPAPTLVRIFFATEFTRHLDRSGYIRFRRWRFYAEAGLAKRPVQVSFYTSTLKIEYQETELAFYTLEWEDNKHIKEVKNPRLIETGYRSPQLTLWTLGPDEWLLFLKLPDYAARKKPQRKPDVIQLPLLDPDENQREPRLIMR